MNYYGIIITVFLICTILLLPRRWAAVAVVAGVIYLTQGQVIILFGINLFAIRLIELAGLIRVIIRREYCFVNLNEIDKAFIMYITASLLIYIIRCSYDVNSRWLITYHIGIFIDAIIVYIVFQGLINCPENVDIFLKDIVIIFIPFTVLMIYEGFSGKNIFSVMGGVPEISAFRESGFRSQGGFRHAILAGSVGATMFPLFIYLISIRKNYITGFLGVILCTFIVYTSHSSGPLMALIFGVMAWMFWKIRKKIKVVRWSILGILILLQIIMKAPVWYIIARISDITGGDGWHRSNLISQWINSIGEWWLLGMSWDKTGNWAATGMAWGGVDATSGYINIAIDGGIISLTLFIILLVKCYKNLGKKMLVASQNGLKQNELLCWGLGASLTSHVVNLISVSYWDQFYVFWYMLLAVISICANSKAMQMELNTAADLQEATA